MPKRNLTAEEIDQILPQTQCGLCDHGGCMPYAKAIINNNERIDRCPPGGVEVLKLLGKLTGIDPTPYIPEMEKKAKPTQQVIIREAECIGCTKCIQACPVDAIVGAAKQMHTVIADECTGCELCIEPCPMDCIDIITLPKPNDDEQRHYANKYRQRYYAREERVKRIQHEKNRKHKQAKIISTNNQTTIAARRTAIMEAVARSKTKKESHS